STGFGSDAEDGPIGERKMEVELGVRRLQVKDLILIGQGRHHELDPSAHPELRIPLSHRRKIHERDLVQMRHIHVPGHVPVTERPKLYARARMYGAVEREAAFRLDTVRDFELQEFLGLCL